MSEIFGGLFLASVVFFITIPIIFLIGNHGKQLNNQKVIDAVKEYQIEAVERGFGEWEVSTDGSTVFKWKE